MQDVILLVVGISDESRERGEGDNDIWVEWLGLVEMGKKMLHTADLVLQHHQRQAVRTIHTLAPHCKTWKRKL